MPPIFRRIARSAPASPRTHRLQSLEPSWTTTAHPRRVSHRRRTRSADAELSPEIEEHITAALTEAELCESFSSKKRGITALELALQSAPDDLRLNRTLGLLYRQEGESAKAAGCYGTMQRVLESLGETEAAGYYANLAGSGQTTTWEAKRRRVHRPRLRAFGRRRGDNRRRRGNRSLRRVGSPSGRMPPPSRLPPSATEPPAPPVESTENVSELVEEVRFCLAQQIWV